jgi:hypothetical protein
MAVQTEDVIHRVHWSLLQRHSEYFVDLQLTQGDAKNIIVLEGIKANDFLRLLSIVYPRYSSAYRLCARSMTK